MHQRHDEVLARHDLQSLRPPHRAIGDVGPIDRRPARSLFETPNLRSTNTPRSSGLSDHTDRKFRLRTRSLRRGETTEPPASKTAKIYLKLHERFARNAV